MPRDIHVFLEKRCDDKWTLVSPMIKNHYFNEHDSKQNQLNDAMYINQYYPESIYSGYNPLLWELLGVEGKFSPNIKPIPLNCCKEISLYHQSFGNEAFDEHWLYCDVFLEDAEKEEDEDVIALASKIKLLGETLTTGPKDMRMILWFSQ